LDNSKKKKKKTDPAKLSELLQGSVTKSMLLEKLKFVDGNDATRPKQEWIKEWIQKRQMKKN
jgi:hypothetical protein